MGTAPPTRVMLRVTARSSRVEVFGVADADVIVEGGTAVVGSDGGYDVSIRTGNARITCPENSVVVVSTSTGAVQIHGHVADVRVITSTGKVTIERALDIDVRTSTGSVEVGSCMHSCRVVTTTGSVDVHDADTVEVSTSTARVRIGQARVAQLHSLSGSVAAFCSSEGSLSAHTVSGNIDVDVPPGSTASLHLTSRSGRVVADVPEGAGVNVSAVSGSGNIRVGCR